VTIFSKLDHCTFRVYFLEEERALAEYVMFHGFSIKSTGKLAWEYPRQNLKDYPDAWDNNSEWTASTD